MSRVYKSIYSEEEVSWLRENSHLPTFLYHSGFVERFNREISLSSIRWKRRHLGLNPGRCLGSRSHRAIGDERIDFGRLSRKIGDVGPKRAQWRLVHIINWEALHGPLPPDTVLKCLGDPLDVHPSNWEPVHRYVLAYLAGFGQGRTDAAITYYNAPKELKPTHMAVAKLRASMRARRRA